MLKNKTQSSASGSTAKMIHPSGVFVVENVDTPQYIYCEPFCCIQENTLNTFKSAQPIQEQGEKFSQWKHTKSDLSPMCFYWPYCTIVPNMCFGDHFPCSSWQKCLWKP